MNIKKAVEREFFNLIIKYFFPLMQRRPRSTPNVILNSSRNHHQNQVFEITLDEEDEKTSLPLSTRQHLGNHS